MNNPRPFNYSRVNDGCLYQIESAYEMTSKEWNQIIDEYIIKKKQLGKEPSETETITFNQKPTD